MNGAYKLHVQGVFLQEDEADSIGVLFVGPGEHGLQLDMEEAAARQVAKDLRSGRPETMPDGRPGRVCVVTCKVPDVHTMCPLELLIGVRTADQVAGWLEREAERLSTMVEVSA